MEYANKEALLEALSLNKNASAGYDEYPDEDMESILFMNRKRKKSQKSLIPKVEYEDDFRMNTDTIQMSLFDYFMEDEQFTIPEATALVKELKKLASK